MATPRKTAVATRSNTAVALNPDVEAAIATDIAKFQERLAAPTGNRIGVTQDRRFRLPTDDKVETIEGVIVDFVAKKAYYPGEFDRDNIVPPACFAIDALQHAALTPSDNSPERQADSCVQCPMNAWGSDPKGGKGKACKDSYILALLPTDADATTELMTLEISATAIKAFDAHVRNVSREFGKPLWMFTTQFYMDPSVDYSSVRCGEPVPASPELINVAYARRQSAMEMLLKEPDVSDYAEKTAPKGRSKLQAPVKRPPARRTGARA